MVAEKLSGRVWVSVGLNDLRQLHIDNRLKNKWLFPELVTGAVLSFWIVSVYFTGDTKFEELALGSETTSYQALDENKKPIHIVKIEGEEEREFITNWKKRGRKGVVLFFGNSQMHSVNQMKTGEVNFLELLYAKNRSDTAEVLGNSLPNAGLQEFYLAYEYWKDILPLKTIVIPVFMDDMREDGVRSVFFSDLVNSKYQLRDTADYLARQINKDLRGYWSNNPNNKTEDTRADMAALRETFQEKTEIYLNDRLEQNSLAWNNRKNVRGDMFHWLYKFRNTVFGINASSVRRMIPQRFEWNMHALELIIMDCIQDDRRVVLYIPPIRSDVRLPYDAIDYELFKKRIEALTRKYKSHVAYRNYEGIIPGSLWGYKAATDLTAGKEIDYMHFQFRGHQILADSLENDLSQLGIFK